MENWSEWKAFTAKTAELCWTVSEQWALYSHIHEHKHRIIHVDGSVVSPFKYWIDRDEWMEQMRWIWIKMQQTMRNIFTEHIERESAGSKRCKWNTKKRGRKINKQTDEKQETHKLCVQSLSHARVEKAHKFISLTRYFHAIPFIFRTNRIVNCKLWKCCHNTTQRWWMAGKRCAVLCCDSFVLAKYPGMQNTRSTNAIQARLWWFFFSFHSKH